jgi:hypothetical protein
MRNHIAANVSDFVTVGGLLPIQGLEMACPSLAAVTARNRRLPRQDKVSRFVLHLSSRSLRPRDRGDQSTTVWRPCQ